MLSGFVDQSIHIIFYRIIILKFSWWLTSLQSVVRFPLTQSLSWCKMPFKECVIPVCTNRHLNWEVQVYWKEKGLSHMHMKKRTPTTTWLVLLVHFALVINSCFVDLGGNNPLSQNHMLLGKRVVEILVQVAGPCTVWQMVLAYTGMLYPVVKNPW